MPRNGWTKKRVIEAAAQQIAQYGTEDFSMRSLAATLQIKPASLYNHVTSLEALRTEVCAYVLRLQREMEVRAIAGKQGGEGIMALANAYRRFAKENQAWYRLILQTAASGGEQIGEIAQCIVEPFFAVLEHTSLTETEKIHWQRVLRGMVHGFVSQEEAGFFSHLPADADESFQTAIQCYLDGLMQAEARKKE